MYSLGIDSGSSGTKAILFDGQNIIEKKIMPTGANPKQTIEKIYQYFAKYDIGYIISTGYGMPEAQLFSIRKQAKSLM